MRMGVKKLLILSVTIKLLISLVLGLYTYHHLFVDEHVEKQVTLIINKGMSNRKIGNLLIDNEVFKHKIIFYLVVKYYAFQHQYIQAGEYEFTPNMHFFDIIDKLMKGEVVKHYITVPEGYTNHQIFMAIEQAYGLMGQINVKQYKEGDFLPQTYQYRYGDTKEVVLKYMQDNMQKVIKQSLDQRNLPDPLKNVQQLLTLASIVELETPLPAERPKVARVYLNRLLKGMPLQADPTVIYAITNGEENWGRSVTYKDLEYNSPFNTYRNIGLPPSPIANPGLASIQAVMAPADSDNLYFVADGKGGHIFAPTYEQHLNNVKAYRTIKKLKK